MMSWKNQISSQDNLKSPSQETEQKSMPWMFTHIESIADELVPFIFPNSMPAEYFFKQINWKQDSECEEPFEIETQEGIKFLRHYRPFAYTGRRGESKIIDLIVIADTKNDCNDAYAQRKQDALKNKVRLRNEITTEFVSELSEFPGILGILGRGSVFDPDRLPTKPIDTDIILFWDLNELDHNVIGICAMFTKLQHIIKTHYPTKNISFALLDTRNKFAGEESSPPTTEKFEEDISVYILGLINTQEFLETTKERLRPYERRTLEYGEILFVKDDSPLKDFLEKINKVGATKSA